MDNIFAGNIVTCLEQKRVSAKVLPWIARCATTRHKPQTPRGEVTGIWQGDQAGAAVPVTSPGLRASQVVVAEVPKEHPCWKGATDPSLGLYATAHSQPTRPAPFEPHRC